MIPVVGIFGSSDQAACAGERLEALGLARDRINLLTPGSSRRDLASVPTAEAEPPAVGRPLGAVVGGAAGAATGVQLATAAAAMLTIPGVGPVIVTGLIAGAILGLGAGATIGGALENVSTQGVPKDEMFVYEDALRQGRMVLIALPDSAEQAEAARAVLKDAGAESVDAARESWWVGLRDAEQARYTASGGDFARDERTYRLGFEAALHPRLRGRDYAQSREMLRAIYPGASEEDAFRRGYESGQAYQRSVPDAFGG